MYFSIGKQYNIPVVDLFQGFEGDTANRQNYLLDGLHLNAVINRDAAEGIVGLDRV